MKFYLFAFLLFYINACSKDHNTPDRVNNTPSNQMFPDEIGDQWIYAYDNGYSSNQYIYVNIVGTGTLPDGQNATIWTATVHDSANNQYLMDSNFVVTDDKKAIFYSAPCRVCSPQMFYEIRRYVFPLQVNNKWFSAVSWGDTTKVLSQEALTVPAGTFLNTFKLSRKVGFVVNSYTNDSTWLTPNIGLTKLYQNEYSLGPLPGNGTWELMSYNLK